MPSAKIVTKNEWRIAKVLGSEGAPRNDILADKPPFSVAFLAPYHLSSFRSAANAARASRAQTTVN